MCAARPRGSPEHDGEADLCHVTPRGHEPRHCDAVVKNHPVGPVTSCPAVTSCPRRRCRQRDVLFVWGFFLPFLVAGFLIRTLRNWVCRVCVM